MGSGESKVTNTNTPSENLPSGSHDQLANPQLEEKTAIWTELEVKPTLRTEPEVKPTLRTEPEVKPTLRTEPDIKLTLPGEPEVKPTTSTERESHYKVKSPKLITTYPKERYQESATYKNIETHPANSIYTKINTGSRHKVSPSSFKSSNTLIGSQHQVRTQFSTSQYNRKKVNNERYKQQINKVHHVGIDDTLKSQISHMLNSIRILDYDLSKNSDSKQQAKKNNEPPQKYEAKPQEFYEKEYFDSSNIYRNQLLHQYEIDDPSALRFLESYGFKKGHCLEALMTSNGDEELSLYLLYIRYFNGGISVKEVNKTQMNTNFLLELRQAERNMLKLNYKSFFIEKDNLWTFKLNVNYLVNISSVKATETYTNGNKLILDIFLSPKYPFVPPLVLLKPNRFLEPPMNLQISKRLFEETWKFCGYKRPVIQVMNLLENIRKNKDPLERKEQFIFPDQFNQIKTDFISESEGQMMKLTRQDRMIVDEYRQRMTSSQYKKMQLERRKLPAWNYKQKILNSIGQNQIIILKGETGCGKSTQVPQFIFDEWIESFHGQHLEIVCTQPRRLSALGVATRVSDERLEKIGHSVGYQIRFNHRISENTRLTFCTMGVLLNRIQREPTLGNITHVIVDEVHERSAESDFLLLILKNVVKSRKDLKVILMSATVDTLMLSEYFVEVPIIEIPGRTHPVRQIFLEEFLEITKYTLKTDSDCLKTTTFHNNVDDTIPVEEKEDQALTLPQLRLRYKEYSEKTCQTLFNISEEIIDCKLIEEALTWIITENTASGIGTILIFLPGIGEILTMKKLLEKHRIFGERKKYRILPLHSSIRNEEQSLIFEKIGQSKIILSTNIAETSITIEDCVFVIDSGKMKQKRFDPETNIECLETLWVSRANALQRKGRAGRVRPGVCIHLYTKYRFEHNLILHPISEIKRIPLDNLVLQMKVLINYDYDSIAQVFNDFIEPPPTDNMRRAMMNLRADQVIDGEENLTPLGYHLAALPLNVKPGKLLLYGVLFNCVDAALTMAAYLSHKSPFSPPFDNKKEFIEKKKLLSMAYSDPITIFRVYRESSQLQIEDRKEAQEFMDEHFISSDIINEVKQIKYQLLQCLISLGFIILDSSLNSKSKHDNIYKITGSKYNQNEKNTELVKSVLCASFYPNVAKKILHPYFNLAPCEPLYGSKTDVSTLGMQKMCIDPNSVNFGITSFPCEHFIFNEKEKRRNKLIFSESTMVSVKSLFLFSNCDFSVNDDETIILLENNTTSIYTGERQITHLMTSLRKELQYLSEEAWKHPALSLQHQEKGKKVIDALAKLVQ